MAKLKDIYIGRLAKIKDVLATSEKGKVSVSYKYGDIVVVVKVNNTYYRFDPTTLDPKIVLVLDRQLNSGSEGIIVDELIPLSRFLRKDIETNISISQIVSISEALRNTAISRRQNKQDDNQSTTATPQENNNENTM